MLAFTKPFESWRPMKSAPKDRPILAWCVSDCCEPPCGTGSSLCLFHAHAEGLSESELGPHVVVWGGSFDDSTWEYPNGAYLPDWWFRFGSDFEEAANPIAWKPIMEAE